MNLSQDIWYNSVTEISLKSSIAGSEDATLLQILLQILLPVMKQALQPVEIKSKEVEIKLKNDL